MLQLRLMGDDPDHVDEVLQILLPLLRSCPDLQVGDETRLRHRGGGGRVVVDVTAAARRTRGRVRVTAERVDAQPPRRGAADGRRVLPPGR